MLRPLRNILIREPTKRSIGLPPTLVLISHPRVETIFGDDLSYPIKRFLRQSRAAGNELGADEE